MNRKPKQNTVELFLPSLKSNIEKDPVFHNVKNINIEYKLYI
jgi:hypothetical protein